MFQTDAPHGVGGDPMGFTFNDVVSFAHDLRSEEKEITGAWVVPDRNDGSILFITVSGMDDQAEYERRRVRERVQDFIDQHRLNLQHAHFVFDYMVFADPGDRGVGAVPSLPDDAIAI
jgi:hypothetical protein